MPVRNAGILNINTVLEPNIGKITNKPGSVNNYNLSIINKNHKNHKNYKNYNKNHHNSNNHKGSIHNGDSIDLQYLNTVMKNNVSSRYNIVRYLGEGLHGSLYLATDPNSHKIIVKRIYLKNNTQELQKQLDFELNVLRYLSRNNTTSEYINPCLEYKIVNDQIITLFPVFDGYSLHYLKSFLAKLKHEQYYKIILYLIKIILHGLANIHKLRIAHQNITENSILVSTYTNEKEIHFKFTDFGLGCNQIDKSHLLDIEDYKNHSKYSYFDISQCKENNNTPIELSENLLEQISKTDYLNISQKYDVFCLGVIFLSLLLPFENINISRYLESGFTHDFTQVIKRGIIRRYLENINDDHDYKNIFQNLNINNETKRHILEYLDILDKYIFCPTVDRKTCQYILDKIIIYKKYKNDIF